MQFLSVRGAVTAAAMMFVSLCGAAPSAARAEAPAPIAQAAAPQSPAVVVSALAATPTTAAATASMPGSTWISQGTVIAPGATRTLTPAVTATPTPAVRPASLMALVGDMPVETDLSGDLKCLAQAVYFEARGEPIEGQLAVAEVVINRAKSGIYPDNYCDVITQPAQFSFVRRGRIPSVDEASAAWRRAKAIAEIAEQNLWQTKAADALYFHATYVNPSWSHQKVQLAQIDTHIFYR